MARKKSKKKHLLYKSISNFNSLDEKFSVKSIVLGITQFIFGWFAVQFWPFFFSKFSNNLGSVGEDNNQLR